MREGQDFENGRESRVAEREVHRRGSGRGEAGEVGGVGGAGLHGPRCRGGLILEVTGSLERCNSGAAGWSCVRKVLLLMVEGKIPGLPEEAGRQLWSPSRRDAVPVPPGPLSGPLPPPPGCGEAVARLCEASSSWPVS